MLPHAQLSTDFRFSLTQNRIDLGQQAGGERPGLLSPCPGPAGGGTKGVHAQLRSPAERANAQLKTWRILRKLHCWPWHTGQLAKTIHVLQPREIAG
jgi:hypothetical protein